MLNQSCRLHPNWSRLFIILLLVLGVFFRFVNLDRKVYWHDEVYTSLRVSGYSMSEVVQQVFDGHEVGIEDLQKYQRVNPESKLIDTIKSLAVEDPQHPPLYYVLLRFWVQWFGNSTTVTRSLSALISLLVFPCIYWLCRELFKSLLVGWVAIALIAVSPVHVLFAQEAREYGLWTVTILLSSTSLLQAIRLKTKLSWGIYAINLTLGLYTFPFTTLVALSHFIYVLATERFRFSKTVNAYLLASFVGLIAFTPWLLTISNYRHTIASLTSWTKQKIPILVFVKSWEVNLSRVFLDFDFRFNTPFIYLIPFLVMLLCLVVYSIYFLCRQTPKRVWLFILTLIGATTLPLILPDLITGGIRSLVPRYQFPCYLGIQLAVAYLFTTKITSDSFSQRRIWQLIISVLLSIGVMSCLISSQAETWWNKGISYSNPEVASTINQSIHPLLLSNSAGENPGNIISLSYLLEPKVRFRLVVAPKLPKILNNFSDVFLFDGESSKLWRSSLEKENNSKVEPILERLWRLEP